MKKRWINTALCAAMITNPLAGYGLKSPDIAATVAPATTEASTIEAAGTEGDAAEEAKTEVAADTSDMPGITLVVAEVNLLDTIAGRADSKLKEIVEEVFSGKIKIDLQVSGVPGLENDVLGTILGGGDTIGTSRISAFALINYGVEKSVLLSIPYTFASRDHFWKFADSDLASEFLVEPHDSGLGVRDLCYGEESFRYFLTVREVKGLDDLKGMKLRVSNNPITNSMAKDLGASPTVAPPNELYPVLQTGTVDSTEQLIASYSPNAFQEAAPNLILDSHTLGAAQVIITDEVRDRLAEEQQNILAEVRKVASQFNRTISEEAGNKILEELKANGISMVEILDIKPWQDVCKDIIEFSTRGQAELYQQILDINK